MTAVLTVRVGRAVAGSCGEPCYDAAASTARDCSCVCAGMNHGAGLERALANTRAHHAAWIRAARDAGQPIDAYVLATPVLQPALF